MIITLLSIIAGGVWTLILLILLVIARVSAVSMSVRNSLVQWQEQQQAAEVPE